MKMNVEEDNINNGNESEKENEDQNDDMTNFNDFPQ